MIDTEGMKHWTERVTVHDITLRFVYELHMLGDAIERHSDAKDC